MSETLDTIRINENYRGPNPEAYPYWRQVESLANEFAASVDVKDIAGSTQERKQFVDAMHGAYQKVIDTSEIPAEDIEPALNYFEKVVGARVTDVVFEQYKGDRLNDDFYQAIEDIPLSFGALRDGDDRLFNEAIRKQKEALTAPDYESKAKAQKQAKDLTSLSAHFALKHVSEDGNPIAQEHKMRRVLGELQQAGREDKEKKGEGQLTRQTLNAYLKQGYAMDVKQFGASSTNTVVDRVKEAVNDKRITAVVVTTTALGIAGPLVSANGAHAAIAETHTSRQYNDEAQITQQIDMNKVTIVTPVETKKDTAEVAEEVSADAAEPTVPSVEKEPKFIVPQPPKTAPDVQDETTDAIVQTAASAVQPADEAFEEAIIATPKAGPKGKEKSAATSPSEAVSAPQTEEGLPSAEAANDISTKNPQSNDVVSEKAIEGQAENPPVALTDKQNGPVTADINERTEPADSITADINSSIKETQTEEAVIAAPSERQVNQAPELIIETVNTPEEASTDAGADEDEVASNDDHESEEMLIVADPSERKVEVEVVENTPAEITDDIVIIDEETGETLIVAAPSERSGEGVVEIIADDKADSQAVEDELIIAGPSTTVITEKGKSKQAIVELPEPNIIAAPAPAPKLAPVQEAPVISESLEIVAAKALADIDTNALPENIKANIRPNTNWKNVSLVMEYLMKNSDLNESQAIGVIANMMLESDGVNFDINQRGGPAYGAVQWEGPRRTELEAYAAAQNKPASDPIVQLDFLMLELERDAWNGYAELKKAKGSVDAAIIFEEKFERAGAPAIELRKAYAIGLTDAYNLKWHAAEKAAKPDAQTIANIEKKAEITWVSPVEGAEINSHYGDRGGVHHDGIDYPADIGTPLRAMGDGEVIATLTSSDVRLEAWCVNALAGIGHTVASVSDAFQKTVIIQHANGYQTRYDHVSEFAVNVGDKVKAGDTIAKVGSSGCSTGLHVHVGANLNGVSIDPATLLK